MSTAAPEPKGNMGQPVPRYDAYAKVTGKAAYAAALDSEKGIFNPTGLMPADGPKTCVASGSRACTVACASVCS